jgi:hypothetical protein
MMLPMLARTSLAAVALVAIAWLGVATRDLFLQRDALGGLSFGRGTRGPALTADLDKLRRADLWNPDLTNRLYLASFYAQYGSPRRARAVAEDAVRAEPDNIEAWVVLRLATGDRDPARARQAEAQIHRLNPLAGRPAE